MEKDYTKLTKTQKLELWSLKTLGAVLCSCNSG
jgi:hypothetical protein